MFNRLHRRRLQRRRVTMCLPQIPGTTKCGQVPAFNRFALAYETHARSFRPRTNRSESTRQRISFDDKIDPRYEIIKEVTTASADNKICGTFAP